MSYGSHLSKENLPQVFLRVQTPKQWPETAPPDVTPPAVNLSEGSCCTAIIYCEGHFGRIDGKTANGLVRHSPKYRILSVIDSACAGKDAGEVLDGRANGVPVFVDLEEAVYHAPQAANCLIIGMAPSSGRLSAADRVVVLDAIALKMNIVSGLHEFLSEDVQFAAAAADQGVDLIDIRKPRPNRELRLFDGGIADVTCPRIAVLGTDCAVGKRTTATLLARALNEHGVKAVLIGTGQTGLLQGARHGVALDSLPSQFCCGELEGAVIEAFKTENPDIIIVEGQGALSHPAFCTSAFILRGCDPDSVILQHAPKRPHRCDFPNMQMPTPSSEISLIERFAATKVIGLALNNESMSDAEIDTAISTYERELGVPVTDPLTRPIEYLVEIVRLRYPHLFLRAIVDAQ